MTNNPHNLDLTLSDTASQPDDTITIPKTSAAAQSSSNMKLNEYPHDQDDTSEASNSEKTAKSGFDAKTRLSVLLKDREQEWTAVAEKQGPLRLLDLPMDVLKEIVKEVTHTNDLTALALTHSALHNLAIPHIYSRFDIVWPDAHASNDPRTGVDALTYGLATLCMGDVFTDHSRNQPFTCTSCGTVNSTECGHGLSSGAGNGQRRIGNQYPQFTRKFSLGNGPVDWVQEYLITKESGKMLGTLVALAIARMTNLEAFVWDMPTGVLRDVWLALSSLQSRSVEQDCRLERVWVRWHDNSDPTTGVTGQPTPTSNTTPQMLTGSTMTSVGWTVPSGSSPSPFGARSYAQNTVEYPTLSVLPPLKSLSVLDIDELDYLDEMSVLIEKSRDRIRELRVGISSKAVTRDFAIAWDGQDLQQVDHAAQWPGASTIGEKRLGGVMGVLLGRVFDIRKKQKAVRPEKKSWDISSPSSTPVPTEALHTEVDVPFPIEPQNDENLNNQVPQPYPAPVVGSWPDNKASSDLQHPSDGSLNVDGPFSSHSLDGPLSVMINNLTVTTTSNLDGTSDHDSLNALLAADDDAVLVHHTVPPTNVQDYSLGQSDLIADLPLRRAQPQNPRHSHFSETASNDRQRLEGKLRLQTLELERIPLSVAVLQKAFDWSVLTNLTILDCAQHDRLWVMLRKHFAPSPLGPSHSSKHGSGIAMQYHLNLKKIHTDAASPPLISFLKETLAPNTLETLFLQDRRRSNTATVTIDAIYKGPLKRHRTSLRKLMLDSSDKIPRGPTSSTDSSRYRAWMPNRDVLHFITSGRMSNLRELGMAIDYKDWHLFLQRLPNIPHLRSLNVPFIADHVTAAFDPKELANQVVDVIVLRPEVELCYVGISHKCFEILENRPHEDTHTTDAHPTAISGGPGGVVIDEEDEDEDDEDGSDDDDEEEDEDDNGTAIAPVDPDETESEASDHEGSDTSSWSGSDDEEMGVKLRLREILFYDDKVAIFKARHGKL